MITRRQTIGCFLGGALPLLLATAALGQSTSWTGGSGDWGTASNWSNGKPTGSVDALFQAGGTATVSQAGESCRNLLLGTSGESLYVVAGGSLEVTNRIQVPLTSQGFINQDGGSVTADSLLLGGGLFGQYQMNGGTLTVGHAIIGTGNSGASFSTSLANPVMTVTHSLTLGRFSDIVAGAGTISVGTTAADSLVVLGTFQMMNSTVTTTNYVMRNGSVLSAPVPFTGIGPIVSTGAAILDGTLKVNDFGAPNGTYELVRGNPLSGAFDGVELPPVGDWSWHIEGNSLFISKGPVPIEPTTWSRIKAQGNGER